MAVIGSGVAGLTAAYVLSGRDRVTLYEADARLGGHAHTHFVDDDGQTLGVDSAFLVHNDRTYPTLCRLFSELCVATQESEMSMSVRADDIGLEYAGALGVRGLFACRQSLRPRYLLMLGEIVRSAISRTITRQYVDFENKLACITIDPQLERELVEALHVSASGSNLVLEPAQQKSFLERLQREVEIATGQGHQAVLICSTQLRLALRRLVERHIPALHVLAYNEIAAKADVEFVGQVRAA